MFDRVLKEFQDKIRRREYVMTLHAEEEMDDDRLSIFDAESAILTGQIHRATTRPKGAGMEIRRDRQSDRRPHASVVGKLSQTGRLVILTTYREKR